MRYQHYDFHIVAASQMPQRSIGLGSWLLILLLTVVVAALVAGGVLFVILQPDSPMLPPLPEASEHAEPPRMDSEVAVALTRLRMSFVVGPLDMYSERNRGRYPQADPDGGWSTRYMIEGLVQIEVLSATDEWIGPDPQNPAVQVMLDGWGRPFRYHPFAGIANKVGAHNPRTYDLWSAGADGTFDTDDDICNWRKDR